MDLIIIIVAIILLIIISAFFSAAETSITSISQAVLHKLKMSGNKKAAIVSTIHANKERFISTLLLSNSASNTCAAALCTTLMINILGNKESTIIYASFLMTIIIFMFGEVLPKSYAFLYPEKTAFFTAPIIHFMMKIAKPITSSIQVIINYLLPAARKNSNISYTMLSGTDELRGAIDLHHHKGAVVKTERDMLDSILDLAETKVGDIMIHRKKLFTIDANLPISEIVEQALNSNNTRIPLWKDNPDNIVSILHLRDLVRVLRKNQGYLEKVDLSTIISPPWFILENTLLTVQLHEFRKRRNHFALVINEYGDLLGGVTLEDILEEIVGQIEDEHDTVSQGIKILSPNTYIIEGSVTIRDINRELEWNLPDTQASTLAGLMMYDTEIVPEVGETFELYGIKFTVIEKYYNQIYKIKAEKLNSN